jgi:hypothetical protein
MLPQEVIEWIDQNHFGDVINAFPTAGGCINNGTRLETSSGADSFEVQFACTIGYV